MQRGDLARLSPQLVHGILRIGGRLQFSDLPYDVIHPVILPNSHLVTDMIIRDEHQQNSHIRQLHVLACLQR